MKRIIFTRHGKSSWEYNVSDKERPLKPRGVRDAKLVANQFLRGNSVPKKIVSSPAKRALETCKVFAKIFEYPEKDIKIVEHLYDFSGENVVKYLHDLPKDLDEIMIFGHNHAFTHIVNTYGDKFIANLPTSGLVIIDCEVDDWEKLRKGATEQIIIPKELRKW